MIFRWYSGYINYRNNIIVLFRGDYSRSLFFFFFSVVYVNFTTPSAADRPAVFHRRILPSRVDIGPAQPTARGRAVNNTTITTDRRRGRWARLLVRRIIITVEFRTLEGFEGRYTCICVKSKWGGEEFGTSHPPPSPPPVIRKSDCRIRIVGLSVPVLDYDRNVSLRSCICTRRDEKKKKTVKRRKKHSRQDRIVSRGLRF